MDPRDPVAATSSSPQPSPSLIETPIPRRRMLLLLGAGVLAAGSGLGVLLEGCAAAAPVTVTLAVNPATMPPGVPVAVPFSMTNASGTTISDSLWLLKNSDGSLTAYDPRCPHARCRVNWVGSESRFNCNCHGGEFALDGSVLAGPPPRPLDKLSVTSSGGMVTVDVPGDFVTPRESLGT